MRGRKIFIFPCNADWINAGEGRWFGVSPMAVFRRHCQPFSGTIVGHFQAPLLAIFKRHFRRHCWPFSGAIVGHFQAPLLAVFLCHCWPFSGAIAGAIARAPSRRLRASCRRHCRCQSRRHCRHQSRHHLAVYTLVADAIEGAVESAIFWLQVPFPRRFRRASNTKLEASIKEKY